MQKILGIDYGQKKIGIALGIDNLVSPYCVFENKSGGKLEFDVVQKIIRIIQDERVELIIIGNPHNTQQTLSKESEKNLKKLNNFIAVLKKDLINGNIVAQIEVVNERMTSKDAVQQSIAGGISRKKRSEDDAIAACEIIHRYFEV